MGNQGCRLSVWILMAWTCELVLRRWQKTGVTTALEEKFISTISICLFLLTSLFLSLSRSCFAEEWHRVCDRHWTASPYQKHQPGFRGQHSGRARPTQRNNLNPILSPSQPYLSVTHPKARLSQSSICILSLTRFTLKVLQTHLSSSHTSPVTLIPNQVASQSYYIPSLNNF